MEFKRKVREGTMHRFRGKEYPCAEWVTWIALDDDGDVFGYLKEPFFDKKKRVFKKRDHNFMYLGTIEV